MRLILAHPAPEERWEDQEKENYDVESLVAEFNEQLYGTPKLEGAGDVTGSEWPPAPKRTALSNSNRP